MSFLDTDHLVVTMTNVLALIVKIMSVNKFSRVSVILTFVIEMVASGSASLIGTMTKIV